MSDYEKQVEEFQDEELLENEEPFELVGDDGDVHKFDHLATLDYKNEWYVVFQPIEGDEEFGADELVIFQLGTDDETNEDVFIPVEDEKVLNAVYDKYCELVGDDEE